MLAIDLDPRQNLVAIRYSGYVTPDQTALSVAEVRATLAKVEPGFRVLAGLTNLKTMEVACAPHIAKIMELCYQKGVATVVRVMPNPGRDVGLQILSYFHYGDEIRFLTCSSIAEAMAKLSN